MPPENDETTTADQLAGADYVPDHLDAPYTPDNDESNAIADRPEFIGYMPDPENVIEGYGAPDEGDQPNGADRPDSNVAVVAPVRVIPMACDQMLPYTITVNPATVGDGRPQLVVGAQANRRSVTLYNLGATDGYFHQHQEVTANDGTLPGGQAWSGDYRGPIYMLASAVPIRISVVPIFEQ